mgnify:CR=1 FL=1
MSTAASEATKLLDLAQSKCGEDRDQLLLTLSDMGHAQNQDPAVTGLLSDIMLRLTKRAEAHVRTILSRRLASSAWASNELILYLAKDETRIAEPILLNCQSLSEDDLIEVINATGTDHQMTIARRPNLGEKVSGRIVDLNKPVVTEALTWNHSANIKAEDMAKIAEMAKLYPNLQASTLGHPCLPQDIAAQMYTFVADKLKQQILSRFKLDEATLLSELGAAAHEAEALDDDIFLIDEKKDDIADVDLALIERLEQAGRLDTKFLMAALKEKKLSMFEYTLARMGSFDVELVRKAARQDNVYHLALGMMCVGMDKKFIPGAVGMVCQILNRTIDPGMKEQLQRAFNCKGREEARQLFLKVKDA